MPLSFTILSEYKRRTRELEYWPELYADSTELARGLARFVCIYDGTFTLVVGPCRLLFTVDPDLRTVFESLPDELTNLTSDAGVAEIAFFEQGSDLTLELTRAMSEVTVKFTKGLGVGQRFLDIPTESVHVSARDFVREWVQFAEDVLRRTVEHAPKSADDWSYRQYSAKLAALREV